MSQPTTQFEISSNFIFVLFVVKIFRRLNLEVVDPLYGCSRRKYQVQCRRATTKDTKSTKDQSTKRLMLSFSFLQQLVGQ